MEIEKILIPQSSKNILLFVLIARFVPAKMFFQNSARLFGFMFQCCDQKIETEAIIPGRVIITFGYVKHGQHNNN